MKISFSKPKMIALFCISLFAVSCSVKGELQDLAEELDDTNNDSQTEQVID